MRDLIEFVERVARQSNPRDLPGSHLSDETRGQLAFAAIDNVRYDAKRLSEKYSTGFDVGSYIDDHTDDGR